MIIITTMVKILVAMALGFFLRKIKIVTPEANSTISRIIVDVLFPCLIFVSIVQMDSSRRGDVISLILIGIAIYVVVIGLSLLIVRLIRSPKKDRGIYEAALVFGNVTALGIPLAESLYGDVGVFFIAILNVHFNLLLYTYGVYRITKGNSSTYKFNAKKLLNPGIVVMVIAMIIYFAGLKMPNIVMEPLSFLGQAASPFSMISVGASIAGYSLKNSFNNWRLYVIAAFKLLIIPIAIFFILKLIIGTGLMTSVTAIYVGMPTAVAVGMFSVAYNEDSSLASAAVAMQAILSMGTVPLLYMIIQNM